LRVVCGTQVATTVPDLDNASATPAAAARARGAQEFCLGLLAILVLATSLIFSFTDLDVRIARQFASAISAGGGGHWTWDKHPVVVALYRFGTWPGLLAVGVALVGLLATWRRPATRCAGRGVVFIVLTVIIGPGLLVNMVGKDHWGRPRPRDLVEFGGHQLYAAPGLICLSSVAAASSGHSFHGTSFPCGHSSVGFALGFACAALLWRTRRRLALTCLGLGLVYGGVLGVARMCAGAHFLSDVLWSAYVPALVAMLLWWWLRPPLGATAPFVADHDRDRSDAPQPDPRTPVMKVL